MPRKKTTIDDLARMVKGGFDEVTDWQKWATKRFVGIDEDLKAIRKQLAGVVYRPEFEKLETRVKDIEDLLAVATKRR